MNVMISALRDVYLRDLSRLTQEVKSYKNEKTLWLVEGNMANTAGNLALHLCGNLKYFIGATIGSSGYIRDRTAEFNSIHIPRTEILQNIEQTKQIIETTLNAVNDDILEKPYPLEVFGKPTNHAYFLTHLIAHLGYHMGQINYHRRLLDK